MLVQQAATEMVESIKDNYVDSSVLHYTQRLVEATQEDEDTSMGASIHGTIAMAWAARVWITARGHNYVLPDDVKELAALVWTHQLIVSPEVEFIGVQPTDAVARVLAPIEAPASRMNT